MDKNLAVIGSGPAALMVADRVSKSGYSVDIFERRPGPARKLYIAGSSGLNISSSLPLSELIAEYRGFESFMTPIIHAFTPEDWLQFIEKLGLKWFEGTSSRYFVEQMHAADIIRKWRQRLSQQGCLWRFQHELIQLNTLTAAAVNGRPMPPKWQLEFNNGEIHTFNAVCLCLGGASYEEFLPLRWPDMLRQLDLHVEEFHAANVGFGVAWEIDFLKEAEGQPLKNIVLHTSRGSRQGDLVITKYGLEGTPIYSVGKTGMISIDLKPDMNFEAMLKKCEGVKENLSPLRRVKKTLNLCPAALALLYHHAPTNALHNLEGALKAIKNFPLRLQAPQPISEAISTGGGLALDELNADLMVKRYPGLFTAGEMLAWDAPTGGFLIQACVSQGYVAGNSIVKYFQS